MTTTTNDEPATRRRATPALSGMLAPVLALLLVSCGSDGDESEEKSAPTARAEGERSGSKPPARSPSPSPSPTPTQTPTPTPTPEQAETPDEAADGRNLDACRDLTCQVEVESGDTIRFDPRFESETFTIHQATAQGIVFSATDNRAGAFQGSISGSGQVETGDVRASVGSTDDGRIILTFRPR